MKAWWPVTSVGLDLGSSSVKAAVVRMGLGKARPVRFLDAPTPAEDPPEAAARPPLEPDDEATGGEARLPEVEWTEEVAPEMAALVRKIKSAEAVAAGLSGAEAYYRSLELPRLAIDKLRQAALYSLEDHLPLSVDRLAADLVNGDQGLDGRRLVWAMESEIVARALARLERWGLSTETVSLDAVGLLAAAERAGVEDDVVVDIGSAKATVICFSAGRALAVAHSPWAGLAMDRHLAAVQGVEMDHARRIKEDQEDAGTAVGMLEPVIHWLASDLIGIIRAAYAQAGRPPARLLVCGGTARLPGLIPALGERLDLEAMALSPFPGQVPPESVIATGLALTGPDFNLARGMTTDRRAGKLMTAVAALLVGVLLLAGGNLWRQIEHRQSTLAELKRIQIQAVRQGLPHLKRVVSPLAQTEVEVSRAKEELAALSRGQASSTMLETIRALDAQVDVRRVRMSDMVVDGSRVTLSGLAETFEALEKFKDELAARAGFREVTLASSKKDAEGVLFQLRMVR